MLAVAGTEVRAVKACRTVRLVGVLVGTTLIVLATPKIGLLFESRMAGVNVAGPVKDVGITKLA